MTTPDTRPFETRVFELAGVDEHGPLDRGTLVKLNRAMRALDESNLYPIRGRFNLTDRAIRRYREYFAANGYPSPLEYVLGIDGDIGRMVNDPRNF